MRRKLLTELDIVRSAEPFAIPCDACNGRGFIQESADSYILCTKCAGDCRLLVVRKRVSLWQWLRDRVRWMRWFSWN